MIEYVLRVSMLITWIFSACKLTVYCCSECPKHTEVVAAFILFPLVLCLTYFIFDWLFSNIAELIENMLQGNSAKGE